MAQRTGDSFVSSIGLKTIEEIFKEDKLRWGKKDVDGLQRLLQGVVDEIEKREGEDRTRLEVVKRSIETSIAELETKPAADEAEEDDDSTADRVASISTGLDEVFKHMMDFIAFLGFVEALFKWFEGEHTTYMAPFFPVIQSSGSGKTRLFVGLREKCREPNTALDFDCKMILCLDHDTNEDPHASLYFDKIIRLQKMPNTKKAERKESRRIVGILDRLLSRSTKSKVVFLFDEAQNLLGNNGFAFRWVRWWLRVKRPKEPLVMPEGAQGLKEVGVDEDKEDELKEVDRVDENETSDEEADENETSEAAIQAEGEGLYEESEEEVAKKVVAVFAGTTSHLANFYSDFPSSGFSRAPKTQYINWTREKEGPTKLYPPFFRLCTIGCYHNDVTTGKVLSEFERAAFLGRPLFAYLQKKEKLATDATVVATANKAVIGNSTLYAILKRMLLSKTDSWKSDTTSLCSILGSRVQMGITTSFVLSSELVSEAYAHLVHFTPDETGDIKKAVARIAFMPDPVCAALAMGLMDRRWALTNSSGTHKIQGETKAFWSGKAMELLSSGLCLPEKGNPGEIMVALYMLFCGDILRFRNRSTLRQFSIQLGEWFSMLKEPKILYPTPAPGKKRARPKTSSPMEPPSSKKKLKSESKETSSTKVSTMKVGSDREQRYLKRRPTSMHVEPPLPKSMEVNFIQVCRNYFRAHSWRTQKGLEWMYESATATSVYPNCPAVDLVAAIRVQMSSLFSYHPLLVSVKCYAQFSMDDITKAIGKMKALLKRVRKEPQGCPTALCLLVFIGSQKTTSLPLDGFGSNELTGFPSADTFRWISVPDNDPFNISNAVRQMTSAYAMTEIYSSHGYVYGEDGENPAKVLRAHPQEEENDFVKEMFGSLLATKTSASLQD